MWKKRNLVVEMADPVVVVGPLVVGVLVVWAEGVPSLATPAVAVSRVALVVLLTVSDVELALLAHRVEV